LFVLFSCIFSFAQTSQEAKFLYNSFQSRLQQVPPDSLSIYYLQCITSESAITQPDYRFIGICYASLAKLPQVKDNIQLVNDYSWNATLAFDKVLDFQNASENFLVHTQNVILAQQLNHVLKQWEMPESQTQQKKIFVEISEVEKIGSDSFSCIVQAGSAQGVVLKQKGGVLTAYSKKDPDRGNTVFGTIQIIEVGTYTSKAIVVRYDSVSTNLLQGDNAQFLLPIPLNPPYGIMRSLADLNIFFVSRSDKAFFVPIQINFIDQPEIENMVLRLMLYDIKSTANDLYDIADTFSSLSKTLYNQRFEGMNTWEALINAEVADVRAFLRFVHAYPAKYMGRSFRLNETFATWVINGAPNSDEDKSSTNEALALYKDYSSEFRPSLGTWIHHNKYYLDHAANLANIFSDSIAYYIANKNYSEARKISSDLIEIGKSINSKTLLSAGLMNMGQLEQAQNQFDQAIVSFTEVIFLGNDTLNAYWRRAFAYSEQEQYKLALDDYQKVIDGAPFYAGGYGSYGWTLIEMGKFKTAKEYCSKAFELDSNEMAWMVNLGHVYLLTDQPDSARIFYKKALASITSTDRFKEGIMSDFDMFIESGWSEAEVRDEMKFVQSEWDKHFKFKVEARESFENGKRLFNLSDFPAANIAFTKAIALEKNGEFVQYSWLRAYERWAAYTHYRAKEYEEALNHYIQSWNISKEHIGDPKNIVSDLEDMINMCSWLDNDLKGQMYKALKLQADRQVDNLNSSNDLYVLSIGLNKYHEGNYQLAEKDARDIYQAFTTKGKRYYTNVYGKLLVGENATRASLKLEIDRAIRNSKYGDCFVLYFGGYASDGRIILSNDTVESWELHHWLQSMRAQKQFVVLDAPNLSFTHHLDDYQQRISQKNEGRDLVFLTTSGSRIEMEGNENGVLCAHLLNGLEGFRKMDGNINFITAKELESFIYGSMLNSSKSSQLVSYSSGVDFNLLENESQSAAIDSIGPIIEIVGVRQINSNRGGKTKVLFADNQIEGRIIDQSGIAHLRINGEETPFALNGRFTYSGNIGNGAPLTVSAVDKLGNISEELIEIRVDQSIENQTSPQIAKNYALLIATDHYDEWSQLSNPIRDVEAIGKILKESYNFEVEIMRNGSKEEIASKLISYMGKKYNSKDQLLIFFAGHGINDPILAGQLVCKDSKMKDKANLPSYIPFEFITDNFDRNDCKHVFLAFDVCFGGAYFDHTQAPLYKDSDVERIQIDAFINRKLENKSRQYLTSGGNEYVPDGRPGAHSPFATKFIEALENGGEKGYVTLSDFVDHMRMISTQPKYGSFGSHHPDGDFVLKYTKTEPTTIQAADKLN
jgi:tetratricopeptide (TPR) repeat protein